MSVISPYPLGRPVTDPRLLQSRHTEINAVLEAVAPTTNEPRHVIVLGEQRSGRSSVLLEVAKRASADRDALIVSVDGLSEADCMWSHLIRRVLIAAVEALATADEVAISPWYQAWRDRVYLRDCRPSTGDDMLSSSLVLASGEGPAIDRAVIQRDLAFLRESAAHVGFDKVLVCIDDASSLTEDIALVEGLVSIFDQVGGYLLLLAGLPTSAHHFVEAASPCLARFVPVWLRPFRGPHQIFTSLSAPLAESAQEWVRTQDSAFLRDVLRLTGGNPYEVMLVGHYLWLACNEGDQKRYVLSSRVLDKVIPHLSLLAAGGDALLDGAHAIDRLPEEHVRQAVELVARARLSVRQIAVARILKVASRDSDRLDRAILTADVEAESERVLTELDELEKAGVIQLRADGEHFDVVGGRPAAVLMKYKARARIGAEASNQPFELNFLLAVGRALVLSVVSSFPVMLRVRVRLVGRRAA